MTLSIWLGTIHAALACPDVDGTLVAAAQHILAADTAGTERDFATVEEALGCSHVTPAQIARYFVLRGGAAELATPGSGVVLFASARAIDPEVWEAALGPDLKATWAGAAVVGDGAFVLDTNADGGWLDGARVSTWPAGSFAGWHVVQVIALNGDSVMYGRSVNLPAGGRSLVATGLPETGARVAEAPADVTKRHRLISPAWLVASAVTAAAGGGLAVGARLQSERVPDYTTADGVDAAWLRERELAYGAYVAWGAAGVLGGLSFVLP